MNGVLMSSLGGAPTETRLCSRAGCSESADWAIFWRNPKIHSLDRRKIWLGCDAHVEYLREFLAARSFPLEVAPIDQLAARPPTNSDSGAED